MTHLKSCFNTLVNRIESMLASGQRLTIAIDGPCGSGKTTLADCLAGIFSDNAAVYHMDDFFLRPEQRTPDRFLEVGGNVDYERFKEEVLLPLFSGRKFSYRPFDCSTFTLAAPVSAEPKPLSIIEGTYSLHPTLQSFYDLKVFLDIGIELQHERIMLRDPSLHRRFFEEWIPLEQRYFFLVRIRELCSIILRAEDIAHTDF